MKLLKNQKKTAKNLTLLGNVTPDTSSNGANVPGESTDIDRPEKSNDDSNVPHAEQSPRRPCRTISKETLQNEGNGCSQSTNESSKDAPDESSAKSSQNQQKPSMEVVRPQKRKSYQRKTKKTVECKEVSNDGTHSDTSSEEEFGRRKKKPRVQSSKVQGLSYKEKESRCDICQQYAKEGKILLYPGHPDGAVEESVAITDEKFYLFNGDEEMIPEEDARAYNRITGYSIYCKKGHLVPLDTGLIDKNVNLYISGYMKPIHDDDPSACSGGVLVRDVGPINLWYIAGFDGGESPYVGIETAYGEYILSDRPTPSYTPIANALRGKLYLTKFVIEYLIDQVEPTYEDLINKLNIHVPPPYIPKFNEDMLLKNSQFVIDHVNTYDLGADPDEPLLIVAPCMRALLSLTGSKIEKTGRLRRVTSQKKAVCTKATTTKLVQNMFENFFAGQIDQTNSNISTPRNRRCGRCEFCNKPNCGMCSACRDMKEYGGSGKQKQACLHRRCPNMAVEDAEMSESEEIENSEFDNIDTDSSEASLPRIIQRPNFSAKNRENVTWVGNPTFRDNTKHRTYYKTANIAGVEITVGEYLYIELSSSSTSRPQIAKIQYMFESKGRQMFHGNWLCKGSETVLGETADLRELFILSECDDIPFSAIVSKARVVKVEVPNWAEFGNSDQFKDVKDKNAFFYQLHYSPAYCRFENAPSEKNRDIGHDFCLSCDSKGTETQNHIARVEMRLEDISPNKVLYGSVKYRQNTYRVGDAVYLKPGTLKFKYTLSDLLDTEPVPALTKYDQERYPELYRKTSNYIKGSNYDTPEPFDIGYITSIYAKSNQNLVVYTDIYITVKKMYRPHNIKNGRSKMQEKDLNLLYWSDEDCNVCFTKVVGKCYLSYSENVGSLEEIEKWSAKGPDRFYFADAYDLKTNELVDVPRSGCEVGYSSKNKGKSKSKNTRVYSKPIDYPTLNKKLRTLDVFAGCGGLSSGMEEAGVAETKWAIECDVAAASAYKLNFPGAVVFNDDCNQLLERVMSGILTDEQGQDLPQKGEVDMLCGGPPCQGFSGMNRFSSREYSLFKNSLVVSYLSYCDYYRPKFFVMENVRNFVSFKKSMVLKLTLSCLVRMGYQCTFGILQAGNYGVPQTRKRIIILAAAPGEILPHYPEPTHAFSKRASRVDVNIDGKKYTSNCKWVGSAPLRTICVRDAMSDLPQISNGCDEDEMSYNGETSSHFQRMARVDCGDRVRDHICKDMSALVEARMSHIPTTRGSDWRDLPNIVVLLKDKNFTKKLVYNYKDKKSKTLNAVCSCAYNGAACDPLARQDNTLIPWCLPHTGNRHNNWAGLYGRLDWDGFFSTTVTNPEPMGKQGRVLHPHDNRVVSVRECARSQGFKDSFIFYGNIQEKHRQIGNAVPPPMAKAIANEIRKSVDLNELFA